MFHLELSSSESFAEGGVTLIQIQWRSDRGTLKCCSACPPPLDGSFGRQLCTPQRKHNQTVEGIFGSTETEVGAAFVFAGFPWNMIIYIIRLKSFVDRYKRIRQNICQSKIQERIP